MTGWNAAGVARALMIDMHEAIVAAGFPSDLILVEDGPDFIDLPQVGRMVDAARPTYAARHTWRSRLTTLFDLAAV